jgi:hypothetical protein
VEIVSGELLLDLFSVDVGIALPVSGVHFNEVGDFLAEHPEIHVAVKINYYNMVI